MKLQINKIVFLKPWFVALLLILSCTVYADAIPEQQFNNMSSIDISTREGGKVVAKLALDQPLVNVPIGVSLSNPNRIYFDFYNVANGLGRNYQEIEEGDLHSINIVQVGDRTRLVFNLSGLMHHETVLQDNTLLIIFKTMGERHNVRSAAHFAKGTIEKALNSLLDIDFRRGESGEGRVIVDLMHAGAGIDVHQQGEKLVVEFIDTYLPDNLERKLDVVDFGTPIQIVDTTMQGDNVRMSIHPTGRWEHSARQTDTRFVLEVRALTEDEDEIVQRKRANGGYIGERLSLNFQDVEVRAVLQVIADFTNLNIIASDSVGGNLTLRLRDVPWDQALDIVLQANGLAKRQTGNVIFVAPSKEMADRELLDLEAKQQVAEIEPLITETFQLNHRRVNSISFEGMLSNRGTINLDEISNTMTITDIPVKIGEIRKRIRRLDVFERQVMIEARIVDATETFSRNLGVRFGVQNASKAGGNRIGVSGNVAGSSDLAAGGGVVTGGENLNVNLPAAGAALIGGPATLGLSLLKINNSRLINLELSALETDTKGRVIASPRVVTAHGVEAIIEQGDRVPFQQATSSGATSIRFVDAVLRLKVKPLITFDNQIDMELSVNQDKIGQSVNAFLPPAINTKQVTTKVLVENGGTVVIGGIFERNENNVVNKVPLLGDIPYIGHIFRNTSKRDDKRELLVFVTPRILNESLNLQ
ncbi:type IV pilus secretin PilQ family protein [Nitrosomonas aestuarii]|uniref:type IV pilus secretin PilQ family protein n=1 Tax=Nitrosomonas aestuarii TaxID=52441 RepID=UPI000D3002C4|nr:type IV pilus secretin PilQ family protein [Nitrosomonas aestuarii]PTN13056.1 type IV pilus assembly protein PilQ [Nitrosomonas aestuarii]